MWSQSVWASATPMVDPETWIQPVLASVVADILGVNQWLKAHSVSPSNSLNKDYFLKNISFKRQKNIQPT